MKCPTSSAFYFLTKALLTLCDHNFCNLTHDSKTSMDLFFLFTISWMEDLLLPLILATSANDFFLSLLCPELSLFYLKEALYGFSLAYTNCQHQYSWKWGHFEVKKDDLNTGSALLQSGSDVQDGQDVMRGWGARWIHWTVRDTHPRGYRVRFPLATQNSSQFITNEWLISGTFHWIF